MLVNLNHICYVYYVISNVIITSFPSNIFVSHLLNTNKQLHIQSIVGFILDIHNLLLRKERAHFFLHTYRVAQFIKTTRCLKKRKK